MKLALLAVLLLAAAAYAAIWVFQPTNPSISSSNSQGYLAQLPQCLINVNPFGASNGTYGLPSCVAFVYRSVSIAVWFYVPSGNTRGVIIGSNNKQYPSTSNYVPNLYIGGGMLYFGEYSTGSGVRYISTTITPGWHLAVWAEGAISSNGATLYGYLDGVLVGSISLSGLTNTVGGTAPPNSPPIAYWDIGAGYTYTVNWPSTTGTWFFFNGTIGYVAIYNTVLNQSQVQQLYSVGFPNTLYGNNLVASYFLNVTYYQGLSSPRYYFVPYFVNSTLLGEIGVFNVTAVTITPSGSVGQVPSSQFVGPFYQATFNFYGAVANDSGISFQPIAVCAATACPGYAPRTTTSSCYYTSSLTVPMCGSSISLVVSALPNGWYNYVWSSTANSFVVGRIFTITPSNFTQNNIYYVIAGTNKNITTLFLANAFSVLPPTQLLNSLQYAIVTISLTADPSASYYQALTLNGTIRFPFSPSATSYTFYFAVGPGRAETFGVTPNGPPGVYFAISNTTTYTTPNTPHSSTLMVPTTAGIFFANSLGDWWNATDRPRYAAALVNGTGNTGNFTIQIKGQKFTASYLAWDGASPPNATIYFTGIDNYTYALNPALAEGMGVRQIFAGGGAYFVPVVLGRTLKSTALAFLTSGGVWLNETSVNGAFTAYFPLPKFAFPGAQVLMHVNGTARPKYLTAVLAVLDGKLQQYVVKYLNATVWGSAGELLGSAAIKNFTFIGFAANRSLAPIWVLLNGTVGVPPMLISYFPQIKYLMMPNTASTPYASVQVSVNVPSQLVNMWSGNLVFGATQMAASGYYALMTGGFYSAPPTYFTIVLPASAVGQIAYFLMASWPSGGTCTLLQQVSSPLELTICQGAASQNIAIDLGTATVSSPAYADLPGAWTGLAGRVAPVSAILANAGVAALVVLMIRRGRSLTAGLMTAGALVTALGLSLWLPWMIGEGAVMFVVASAVAFTRR